MHANSYQKEVLGGSYQALRFNGTNKFKAIKLKAKSADVAGFGSAGLQSSSLNSLFKGKCKHSSTSLMVWTARFSGEFRASEEEK